MKKQFIIRSSSGISYELARELAAFFCHALLPGVLHALVYSLARGDNEVAWECQISVK